MEFPKKSKGSSAIGGHRKVVEDAVNTKLKAFYRQITEEPIPDQFLDLLDRLDKAVAEKP